jgi:hypothetical protein
MTVEGSLSVVLLAALAGVCIAVLLVLVLVLRLVLEYLRGRCIGGRRRQPDRPAGRSIALWSRRGTRFATWAAMSCARTRDGIPGGPARPGARHARRTCKRHLFA